MLSNLPPDPAQKRLALAVVLLLLVGFFVAASPLSTLTLPRIEAFIAVYGTAICINNSITATLLFAQFSIVHSRALLALANGYLLTALLTIPRMLTLPGAFAPGGLLGAGLQSGPWLYFLCYASFALFVIAYTVLKDADSSKWLSRGSIRTAIIASVGLVAALVCGATVLTTAGDALLPQLMLDTVRRSNLWPYVTEPTVALIALALVLLWLRQRSLLDLWLMVVLCACAIQMVLTSFPASARFSLGWYAGRVYEMLSSSFVLLILLYEITKLYGQHEAKIRRLVDANIIGIFIWKRGGRLLEANEAFLRMVGYDREDLIAGRLNRNDLTPPEWRDRSARGSAEVRMTGTIQPFEKEYFRKDGSRVPVLLGAAAFDENANQGVAFVLDLTERKRAAEALRQTQMQLAHANRVATMGQLTASIAHEIKQPIATARNNAASGLRFVSRTPPDLEEVREALQCVVNDADRAGGIIDRIRAHVRKAPPRKDRLAINDAILEVIALTRGEAVKNGVSVQTRLAEGLPVIEDDRVQLQQVILNLIVNAIEAMSGTAEGPRELLLSTEKTEPGGVLVAVRDSGPGLAPENPERLFDAFYTTKANGMGMGLSICRSIIEAHGGRLWASANAPRGAVFQFTLPCSPDGRPKGLDERRTCETATAKVR